MGGGGTVLPTRAAPRTGYVFKHTLIRDAACLARLRRQHGAKDATRQILAEIGGWLTEGFHTQDLKDAKALLDSLASRV